jgi:hypothetical protein
MNKEQRKWIKLYLQEVPYIECPQCGICDFEIHCAKCYDTLVINEATWCDGYNHFCEQCKGETEDEK